MSIHEQICATVALLEMRFNPHQSFGRGVLRQTVVVKRKNNQLKEEISALQSRIRDFKEHRRSKTSGADHLQCPSSQNKIEDGGMSFVQVSSSDCFFGVAL